MKAMKLVLFIQIILLQFSLVNAQTKTTPKPSTTLKQLAVGQALPNFTGCDPLLLASHELEPIRFPTSEKNLICKNIKSNCCTLTSQQTIYNQWIAAGTRDSTIKVYKDFLDVYGSIFDRFKRVEELAQKILENTKDKNGLGCQIFANAVLNLRPSSQKSQVIALAKKAYRFLYDSRRGLSCSLCDSEAHKAVDGNLGRFRVSHSFCGKLVEETMPFSVLKHKNFMKIAHSLGQFVNSCTVEGVYRPNRNLAFDIKFFKDPVLSDHIDRCQKNIKENEAITSCHDYCRHFNPSKLDQLFEGDLAKLYSFDAWLKKSLDKILKAPVSSFPKNDLKFKGRLLSESSSPKNERVLPETTQANPNVPAVKFTGVSRAAEVNRFRQEFGIQLKSGITYSASQDFGLKYQTNFIDNLYPLTTRPLYNLAKFSVEFNKSGINFLIYGYNTAINDKTFAQLAGRADPAAPVNPAGVKSTAPTKPVTNAKPAPSKPKRR